MVFNLYGYHAVQAVSAAITLLLIGKVRNGSLQNTNPYLKITLQAILLWIVAQAGEIGATTLPSKLFFANLQYISIVFTPPLILKLVLHITEHKAISKSRLFNSLLFGLPLLFHLFLWTDGYHHLIRQQVSLQTYEGYLYISKNFGPVLWLYAPVNFFVSLLSLIFLIEFGRKEQAKRPQLTLLFLGILLPVITTFLHLLKMVNFPFDLTPMVFSISGLLIFRGIAKHHLFHMIPVAYSVIFSDVKTGIIIFSKDNTIADINPQAQKILALPYKELLGAPAETALARSEALKDFYVSQMHDACEIEITLPESHSEEPAGSPSSDIRYYEVSRIPLTSKKGIMLGQLLLLYNITQRKRVEVEISYAASHDDLTGLLNRGAFLSLGEQLIDLTAAQKEGLVCVFIDLDNFKTINDQYGHSAGDLVIKETALQLKAGLRNSDIVARMGGDEFVMLLPGLRTKAAGERIVQKAIAPFSHGVMCKGDMLDLQMSIGLSIFPYDGENLDQLLHTADTAMYKAKQQGKNRICFAE